MLSWIKYKLTDVAILKKVIKLQRKASLQLLQVVLQPIIVNQHFNREAI